MSLGGVVGELFNAIVAPQLFNTTLEYPLAVVAACMLMPRSHEKRKPGQLTLDLLVPMGVGLLAVVIVRSFQHWHVDGKPLILAASFAPPAIICLISARRPVRFALGI